MKISWTKADIDQTPAQLIVVPYRKGGNNPAFAALDSKTNRSLKKQAKTERFDGEKDRKLLWQGELSGQVKQIMVVGLGANRTEPNIWRLAIARAVAYASYHAIPVLALFSDGPKDILELETRWTAEALLLAEYRFDTYKSKKKKTAHPREAILGVYPVSSNDQPFRREIRIAKATAAGVTLARDLINEPANILSPEELARRARTMAGKAGLTCSIWDRRKIEKANMRLFLAVAAGSNREPRFIHLTYKPRGKAAGRVALVGKGITFDSGGLCIKPPKSMFEQKTDMSGAATVIGAMSALKAIGCKSEEHGVIPVTDNSINGDATRPGDVFTSLSGITVEVLNTDAEGRLILADALTYAKELKPRIIIDHATLTGACEVALGSFTAGIFANKDEDANQYLAAAERTGESMWRLPLLPQLDSSIKSEVADIKNVGSRWGGAITAALFLRRFVGKQRWIHLDIAGPARTDKGTALCPKGGTGYGVLTLLEYLTTVKK